ncbi:hypothetical protein PR202_ga00107 [Eleusine coracana subsp. coracana]|uniref:Major facilitator superfamily (MFS) profile domain-containing protein n=1 Tax=Eleusine coracana subsp. coracana TaxID=191504 RepID=A0AAV5BF88_ELECO|nr:hypothetical protein PR202_ga00107 [Eleusine coracana subsp. coracana]
MGFGKFQALVLVYAGTGWLADAMELMLLSFLGPLVRQQWDVSPQHESMLSSVVFAGMLIGACLWGFLSDKYGRRMPKATLVLERIASVNKIALPPGVLTYHREVQADYVMRASENGDLPVRENECTVDSDKAKRFDSCTNNLQIITDKVYPTPARSTGVGIATAIGKIGGIVCPLIAVGMLRSCHQMEAIVVFELVLGFAAVACILFPVETKGREMK